MRKALAQPHTKQFLKFAVVGLISFGDHREGMSRKREFTIFTILSVIGLGLNDLYMFVGVTFLSIGYQAMKAIATFLVTWYNYFSRRFFLEGARS